MWVCIAGLTSATESERFNIISIVTDDQALWTIGAYGNKEVRTPHLDTLAGEGARFTSAFVATPVCSPSRVAFLTGLYGTQVGITDFLNRDEERAGMGLPDTAVTWPAVLQKQGYATALIGKWHLGTLPQFHPTRHGFDHFYGWLLTPKSIDPVLEVDGENRQLRGSLPDLMIDEALRYAEQQRDRPFALLIHFLAPHAPYGPVLEIDSAPYRDLNPTVPDFPGLDAEHVKQETRKYYASVHSVDRNVGRLLEGLDKLDLSRRTIVLFTSDHGYMIGHHGLQHKGNAAWIAGGVRGPRRPNMFDDSIRVPLLIRWPGVVRPGAVIDNTVSNIDTFASVLGMLGVAVPDGAKQQGIDFSPVLRGQSIPPREALFGQYDLHNGGLAFMRMIRTGDWKLVRHYRANTLDELYDLRNDPGELTNVYAEASASETRERLQARLEAWMRSIDDPLLDDRGYDPSLNRLPRR
jgi:uncharacterized sulfatase